MSHTATASIGTCPSDEELLAWVSGRLPPPSLARLLRHTEQCAACALVVAEAGLALGGAQPRATSSGAAAFAAGQLVASRYLIERRLGRGGMGEVYVALDQELNERVALKTVATALAAEPRAVQRLKLELRLARSVSHPHVCRVLELGRHGLGDEEQWFFTLQLIEGESLRHRLLRGGAPSPTEAHAWAQQLALGLAAIHAQSIVHRDIKPENVMLTSTDGPAAALWVDFGLARWDLSDTRSPGLLQGTPDYAAPELLRGALASRASDVYAFGVLLYELFTGSLPFARRASFAELEEAERLRAVEPRPELPPALDALMRQCLQSAPERRPASALEIAERLRAVTWSAGSPAEKSRARGRFAALWLTVLALGFASLGAGWWLSTRARPPEGSAPLAEHDPARHAPLDSPPAIASSPAGPVRRALPSTPRPSAPRKPASVLVPPAAAPTSDSPVTDFGGRR